MTVQRRKSFFYNRVLKEKRVILDSETSKLAEALKKDKMINIHQGVATLPQWCEDKYDIQTKNNERWFKTIVSYISMDNEGQRRLKHKLYLPLHKAPQAARMIFKRAYPYCLEDNCNTLMIYHTNTLNGEFNLVYETKYIDEEN